MRRAWVVPTNCGGTFGGCLERSKIVRPPRFQQESGEVLRETSSSAGECEHASTDGLIRRADLAESGAVIIGAYLDPASPEETTLLDSTCIGLQGLAVAAAAVRLAE